MPASQQLVWLARPSQDEQAWALALCSLKHDSEPTMDVDAQVERGVIWLGSLVLPTRLPGTEAGYIAGALFGILQVGNFV